MVGGHVYAVRYLELSEPVRLLILSPLNNGQSQLSEQIADTIHSLKSPLAAAKLSLDLVFELGNLSDQHIDFLQRTYRKLAYMSTLVNNLLELIRLESNADLELAEIDLNDLVCRTVDQFRPDAEAQGIHFELALPPNGYSIRADYNRIERVVGDLISNAIKYSPHGGCVRAVVEGEDGTVTVRIEDEGLGIASEHLPHLFDRFYRVHTRETHRIEGSGLGLAIVKAAVERHGGTVFVDSIPGEGSVFGFTLPEAPPG
jgi:two-component system phosphate regulon sensor histidine kinase PhoR